MKLDPWADAQVLAQRISQPGAALIAVIGAQSWCQKCRDIYPQFEAAAGQAASHETYVWLDLEQHAEFLGGFVPDDLPLALRYEESRLQRAELLRLNGKPLPMNVVDPGVHGRLCLDDWAATSNREMQ